jgi:hypothetical protein
MSPNSRQIVRPFMAGDCYFLMVEPKVAAATDHATGSPEG